MKQETALQILKSGHNVFLTGEAGSGKTYTLNLFRDYLKKNKIKSSAVALTASTGIASSHIGGTTIHSWSLIGIKDTMSLDELMQLTQRRSKYTEKIKEAKILIVDEISMLHKKQLELSSQVISFIRQDSSPWGGLQVILTGDFLQLPPVDKNKTNELDRDRFAFMSPLWVESDFKVCYLTEQHRNDGGDLNAVLNAIRRGTAGPEHLEILRSNNTKQPNKDVMRLFTHNENVDQINFFELSKIKSDVKRFTAKVEGNEQQINSLINSVLAPKNLELKIGAKVIFVRNNFDLGFVNGTQGILVGYSENAEAENGFDPIVETLDGERIIVEPEVWEIKDGKERILASFTQYPLKLAYAITIHKSQGMTLDEARIDCGRCFENGQGYVALSRLRSIEGLFIDDINLRALELNPLAKKADERFKQLSSMNEDLILNIDSEKLNKIQKTYLNTLL